MIMEVRYDLVLCVLALVFVLVAERSPVCSDYQTETDLRTRLVYFG
jgi:hypothetical protein